MGKKRITRLLVTILVLAAGNTVNAAVPETDLRRQVLGAAASLRLPFVENRGQVADPEVAYVADTFYCRVGVSRNGHIFYRLPGENPTATRQSIAIEEFPAGDKMNIEVHGQDRQTATVSYFPGRDASRWQRNLASFGRVSLGQIAPGIQVSLHARGDNVEKLFTVQPGADPEAIRLCVKGADRLEIGTTGELALSTSQGAMRFSKPVAFQKIGGQHRMVPVDYHVHENTYGFKLGHYDPSQPLVIDPLITVFPFGQSDTHNMLMALSADAAGNIYAAGISAKQLAVFKMDSNLEKLLDAVYFSEDARYTSDIIRCLAIDKSGNIVVAGDTHNDDFPVMEGCHDTRYSDSGRTIPWEGFVTKFSAADLDMLASTFIGGDWYEEIHAMAIDANGHVYVAGWSSVSASGDPQTFPITDGAFDTTPAAVYHNKAVVAKFDGALSTVLAATYLGGSVDDTEDKNSEDVIHCLALDAQGHLWVAGRTTYPDFPVTTGSLDTTYNGGGDVFLSKIDGDLTQLLMSTYMGGSADEAPTDMLFDAAGNLYLLGWTYSSAFPVPAGGVMPTHGNHEEDGFILKLSSAADEILAGTFIGAAYDGTGWGDDVPAAMTLSADGSLLHVVGRTESKNFPTTADCYASVIENGNPSVTGLESAYARDPDDLNWGDGFLATFSADLTRLHYATFLGGGRYDYLDDVLVTGGQIIIAGETGSDDFPMIVDGSNDSLSRGVLLRFGETETSVNPASSDSGGGGGGGGCFVSTCLR